MTKKIITCGILSAVAIVVSSLERFVPIGAIIPLPGIKLGIANCIILFSLVKLDFKCSFAIMICKNLVVSLLFSNPIAFIYSLFGGALSVTGMYLLFKNKRLFSLIGISVAGASLFNVGQIIAAVLILNNIYIYKYLMFLLPVSIVTGVLIGLITVVLIKNIKFRWN